nr:Toll/interleukin-1 receptor (TIR) domain-containing protein [Tanacetum cinerariifolium]
INSKRLAVERLQGLIKDLTQQRGTHRSSKKCRAVGEAFLENKNKDAAGKWRGTLKEATDLAGWELKNTLDGHEAKCIKKFVHEISLELHSINSGFDERDQGHVRNWEDNYSERYKHTSSTSPHTEASDTDSSSDKILKKYDDTLPLTERQLVKYLRKVSHVLFDRIIKDQWEKHKETDQLVEASMSSFEKSSSTINDLYKGLEVITQLVKDITNSVKNNPATNKKIKEACETLAKISTQTTEIFSSVTSFDFSTL